MLLNIKAAITIRGHHSFKV